MSEGDASVALNDGRTRLGTVAEIALIVLVFFVHSGWPPPIINESHYLVKAKHFWDGRFCAGDLFVESANTHWLFYLTFGVLTKWLSLPATAMVGRFVGWLSLAFSWRQLSRALSHQPMISVFSASLFVMLMQETQMSGEWVIGGIEAKIPAYALVLFGLAKLVENKWRLTILCFGFATSWHVLVGGWSLVALGIAWICSSDRPNWKSLVLPICGAGILALPGLLPALAMNSGITSELQHEANRIQVYERLSHHLVFHRFSHNRMLRFAMVSVWWGGMAYWKAKNTSCDWRVTRFVLGAFVIALAGVFIDQTTLYVPGIAASLLRYYWFRIADVFVPMGAALGTCDLWSEIRKRRAVVADWGLFALILSVTAWYASRYFTEMSDLRPESERHDRMDIVERPSTRMSEYRDWVAVCDWMKHNATSTDLTITPRGTQTFKWRTGLPEFVTRKDLPQDARSCVEWWKRIELLYGGSDEFWWENRVAQAAKDYGIRWIIVDRRTDPPRLPYELAYPSRFERNDTYLVYRVNRLGRTPLSEASSP